MMNKINIKTSTMTSVLTLCGILLLGPGNIEGAIFPAARPAEITDVRVDPKATDWVIISGVSERLRSECYPRRLEWNRGVRHGSDVPVEWNWGPPILRSEGAFEFHDWRVRASPEGIFRDGTYADVLHQCHLLGVALPWLTRSRFYDPPAE